MNYIPTLFGCSAGGSGQIVVTGVPYDRSTCSNRAGSAAAPAHLRLLSSPEQFRLKSGNMFDLALKNKIFPGDALSDIGNIGFRQNLMNDDEYLNLISKSMEVICREKKKPLVLGGDHLSTLAILRGLRQAGAIFQVIHLDAHSDYDFLQFNERPTHASFMKCVVDESLSAQVLQIGVRGISSSNAIQVEAIRIISCMELRDCLIPNLDVYLTIDTDAFDPAIMPAVSYPVPEGLPFSALAEVLSIVKSMNLEILGADWMEYNPTYDTKNNITGQYILSGLASIIKCMIK